MKPVLTWGEIKALINNHPHMSDDVPISYIDIDCPTADSITINIGDCYELEVWDLADTPEAA